MNLANFQVSVITSESEGTAIFLGRERVANPQVLWNLLLRNAKQAEHPTPVQAESLGEAIARWCEGNTLKILPPPSGERAPRVPKNLTQRIELTLADLDLAE